MTWIEIPHSEAEYIQYPGTFLPPLSKCNSCCEHVCHQELMLSHDANNDDAGMMIKRSQRALQIEMPTLFRYVLSMYEYVHM